MKSSKVNGTSKEELLQIHPTIVLTERLQSCLEALSNTYTIFNRSSVVEVNANVEVLLHIKLTINKSTNLDQVLEAEKQLRATHPDAHLNFQIIVDTEEMETELALPLQETTSV